MDEVKVNISGYRQLSVAEQLLIKGVKEQANELGQALDRLEQDGYEGVVADKRWLAIAKTELQKGMMFLVRSIAKPTGF